AAAERARQGGVGGTAAARPPSVKTRDNRERGRLMPDGNKELTEADIAVTPAVHLLKVAGELFAELMGSPHEPTEKDYEPARMLRVALAEVGDRAARLFPAYRLPTCACSCGESFTTIDEMDEHFWRMFVPSDDTGLDGKQHAEVVATGE